MNKRVQVIKYVMADFLAAIIAWTFFFIYRKYRVDHDVMDHFRVVLNDPKLYYGVIVIGLFWLALYALIGTYRQIYRKARLREFAQPISSSSLYCSCCIFSLQLFSGFYLLHEQHTRSTIRS
ncbi:MAG: hypothetical protein NTW31_03315 [Bacteroidetes bacterium]|nr:hypothetical protein [Bacteroidota bacterium]